MRDVDKILEKMQIQISIYKEINGEAPTVIVSGNFYEKLLSESISLQNIKVSHGDKYTLLGCKYMVFYSLAFDEFIIGKEFKVTI